MTTKKTIELGRTREIFRRRLALLRQLDTKEYVPPMDVGGSNSSHHSRDLTHMVKLGLVERARFYKGISGGHWEYRLAPQGNVFLEEIYGVPDRTKRSARRRRQARKGLEGGSGQAGQAGQERQDSQQKGAQ
jgi:hypothetical protein